MPNRQSIQIVPVALLWLAGCSDLFGPKKINGVAHIVVGANAPTSGSSSFARNGAVRATISGDELWLVSPNKVKTTLMGLHFTGTAGSDNVDAPLSNCSVTYGRSAPSLSRLLDCPFTVAAGKYTSVRLYADSILQVLIDDPTNSWFTDPASPTGYSTTRPVAGPAFVPYMIGLSPGETVRHLNSLELLLDTPVEVKDSTIALSIIMNGQHSMRMRRTNGVPFVRDSALPPVYIMPSFSNMARVELYSSSGTANSVIEAGQPGATTPLELLFFYDVGGPSMLQILSTAGGNPCFPLTGPGSKVNPVATNTSAKTSQVTRRGDRAGGYLGRDSHGTVAWAIGADSAFSSYASVWTMTPPIAVGGTASISCLASSTAPDPVDGKTYASGAPSIPNPTARFSPALVAK